MDIRLAGIIRESIVDGPGIRFVLFLQGCPHGCKGCHNPSTHSFSGGKVVDTEDVLEAIFSNPNIKGVTFSGGEPFCQSAQLAYLSKILKLKGYHLLVYSGYTFEEIIELSERDHNINDILHNIDIMVDGKYDEEKRDLTLAYRGSSNQRIIDVRSSLDQKRAVIFEK